MNLSNEMQALATSIQGCIDTFIKSTGKSPDSVQIEFKKIHDTYIVEKLVVTYGLESIETM